MDFILPKHTPLSGDRGQIEAIYVSANAVFAGVGFRAATMAKIAKGAGMSRPALYQYFDNKEHIFRSYLFAFLQESSQRMREVFNHTSPIEENFLAAIEAKDDAAFAEILGSPHGKEILLASDAICGDVIEECEVAFTKVLAEWISGGVALGRMDHRSFADTPEEAAYLFHQGIMGILQTVTSAEGYYKGKSQFARLFAAALTV
ncbi:MAG: TetR/AcrR family transcriptional regulator [Halocynthiibacter sp.]